MIHIAYGTSNLYSKFAATSMLSLFDNTNANVTVHILHDNTLTVANREKFVYIAGRYNQQVNFYNIEEICASEIADLKSKLPAITLQRFSIASTFRLLLPKIISPALEKIIYLDADTIVNLDIKELWRVELEDKLLAAVVDIGAFNLPLCTEGIVKPENYFNSGVMVLNLEKWRTDAEILGGGVDFISKNPRYVFGDQDILNYCFSEKYLKLPPKFNTYVWISRKAGNTAIEKKLYHYLGAEASINFDIQNNHHQLYWKYFAQTPFFNSETLFNFYNGVNKIYSERQNLLIKISALMSGKIRAFFTDLQNIEQIVNIFAVQDGEEIFILTSNESVQNLLNEMQATRGKRIFFFLMIQSGNYEQLKNLLNQFGFIEGQDFFNGTDFLSQAHGVPFNAWEIIKNL